MDGVIGRVRHEKATYREEAVYQVAHALGIVTLATRPALVTYTHTASEPAFPSPVTREALLLEHVNELARRLGAEALVDPVDCDPDASARPPTCCACASSARSWATGTSRSARPRPRAAVR